MSMDSGGGGRPGRRGPVVTERLKRRQLARARMKQYDRTAYDGGSQEEGYDGS